MKPLYQHYRAILASVLLLTIIALWSNIALVHKGSVLDQPLMDASNRYVQMTKEVESSKIDFGRVVYFFIRVPKVSYQNLRALVQFSEHLQAYFDERNIDVGVASLSTLLDYQGETLEPFITRRLLDDPQFGAEAWFEAVHNRLEVRGTLMGRTEAYDFYMVALFPPQGFPELEMYRLVKSFLAGRELSYFSLYVAPETMVDPMHRMVSVNGPIVNMKIDPMGWSMGRGDIDFFSNTETFGWMIPAISLVSFVIFILRLSQTGCTKQAFVGIAVILISMVWTRGTIGLLDRFTPLFVPDEAFTLIAYIACIIPGFSFSLRKFEAFNETMFFPREEREKLFWQAWQNSDKASAGPMNLIAFISIMDFAVFMALFQINGSRSMFDIGVIASFGLFYGWALSRFFLPACYFAFGGKDAYIGLRQLSREGWLASPGSAVNGIISWISYTAATAAAKPFSARRAAQIFAVLVMTTVSFFSLGLLDLESDPGEFFNGMRMGIARDELKKEGRPGFTAHDLYIELDLDDPVSMSQLWQYREAIAKQARTVYGLPEYFATVLAEGQAGSEFPADAALSETRESIADIWLNIMDEAPRELADNFIFRSPNGRGALMLVATHPATNAGEMGRFRDWLLEKATEFPKLRVLAPGATAEYPEVDKAIEQGAVINPIFSQIMILVICWIWMVGYNYRADSMFRLSAWRAGACIAIPFITATCVLYLLMMAIEIPFDIATSAISSLCVAVAVDLPIFYIAALRAKIEDRTDPWKSLSSEEMVDEGEKIITDFAVNAPAFIPLMFSVFPVIHRLGWLMVAALIACVIGTLFIMAPMVQWAIVNNKR